MQITPLNDNILAQINKTKTSQSGLVFNTNNNTEAVVIYINETNALNLSVGDIILFQPNKATQVKIVLEDYLVIKEKDIIGNIRFKSFGELQKEYGIDIEAEGVVSTHADLEIDNIIKYQDIDYRIVDFLKFDSHNLFFIRKWKQK